MIVGFDRNEIELIIDDLKFTAKAQADIAKHYESSLQEHPEQTQWLKVIGSAEGRGRLAQEIVEKLSALIEQQ